MSTPNYPALLLNADHTPVSVYPLSTWGFERTFKNEMKGRVIALAHYEVTLRSPSFEYTPPSVVALTRYVKRPYSVPFSRMNIFLRDNFSCQYCGKSFKPSDLTFDHVVPRCQGGSTCYENIVAACLECNSRKGSSLSMRPIKEPRAPKASELLRTRPPTENLHKTWLDYIYWSGALQS